MLFVNSAMLVQVVKIGWNSIKTVSVLYLLEDGEGRGMNICIAASVARFHMSLSSTSVLITLRA